ncbi:serine hydrolase domain-containing protein [Fretibacter rubidus]|uniref:serine hydrolase domain-containing protein n=1 Tax=Fretibacter rubidus TaxID=570162 RepID=UPI00352AD932
MTITRRENLSLLFGAAALSACGSRESKTEPRPLLSPLAGAGLVVVQNGERVFENAAGYAAGLDPSEDLPKRPFTLDSPFRVASISKVVVLLTAMGMADQGVINLDDDISDMIGVTLRNPQYPDQIITLQNILSHRSSISDPAVYWTDPSGDIRSLLSDDMFNDGHPGSWFEYANINYGIAATAMEAVGGERFDGLTRRYVLDDLGIDAGFNWAGMSASTRKGGATLYRKVDGQMTIQVDGPETFTGSGPTLYGNDPNFILEDYVPGKNGTLLSPQGGLRASLNDLVKLAQKLANYPQLHSADWIYDGSNGAGDGGHFVSFGAGLYVYPPELSPIKGQLMVGHHGEAYGMYGGMWHLPQINAQIVHAVTATPEPARPYFEGPPAIAPESRELLDKAMSVLGLA